MVLHILQIQHSLRTLHPSKPCSDLTRVAERRLRFSRGDADPFGAHTASIALFRDFFICLCLDAYPQVQERLPGPFKMSGSNCNNIWSHRLPSPCLNCGNGPFMLPNENIATGGSSSLAYYNIMPTLNTTFSSSSSSDLVNYGMANLGASCGHYMHHFLASRSSLIPPNYTHSRSYYNQPAIRGSSSSINSQTDYDTVHFNRKSSAQPSAHGPQCWHHSSTSLVPEYRSNGASAIGEGSGSHCNVRSRHCHALYLENNLVRRHELSSLSYNFHQTASTSGHEATSLDSFRRFPSSGFSSSLVTSRDMNTSLPTHPGIPTQDNISYGQRPNQYSSASGYPTVGLPGTWEERRLLGNEVVPHLRHHRRSSMIGQIGERNGRTRSFHDNLSYRMNALADEGYVHNRWVAEDALMIDGSLFSDSHVLFDQHEDIRLDIDNMGYEELLALGDRIGNVCTGLSEIDIVRCLTRMIYSSSHMDSVEGSCVICLEEYEDGQSIGRLKCRHDFHALCIKKWLFIKNACPICKAAALGDTHNKGKEVLFM